MKLSSIPSAAAICAALVACEALPPDPAESKTAAVDPAIAAALSFDAAAYTLKTASVDGVEFSYRAYEGIVYVASPVDAKYQTLNFYAPAAYYEGKAVGSYTAETAPIFLPNDVGGYMPAEAGKAGLGRDGTTANAALVALSKGLVVASPGARGRTTQAADGTYTGKAPAAIVDLKAAVRYLRFNDAAMPGSAERIVSNGTSAGGALSALLGASGNGADYEPYLQALGAAPARDDIFAVSAYCPITNLENADAAYEWWFSGYDDYQKMVITMMTDWRVQRTEEKGTLTAEQSALAAELKKRFPAYLNSLGLRDGNGKPLVLDEEGEGSFKEYVKELVAASAQKELDAGKDLSAYAWLTISGGKATDVDFSAYTAYAVRMKLPPAFDALDLSSGENSLFGAENIAARHFTAFSLERDASSGAASPGNAAPAELVKLMNPLNYIGEGSAKNWRIRHGTIDRDTSLAIPAILALTLENAGFSVDFALPWDRPHSGDYDLEELFAWIESICANK